jgi:N-acetylmuramoyl-L-alanine amidase CwlA
VVLDRKHIIQALFFSAFTVLLSTQSYSQNGTGPYDTIRVDACIEANGDTIPCSWLPTYETRCRETARSRRMAAAWTRLRNAVYVTYPYAIKASVVMNQINAELVNVTDKKARKAIIKSHEKELKKEFADKLTQLSVYQGKVLMKLIYRETGNNCYEILEEYKGSVSAGFWQTVALVFGSNLRQNYEPNGTDRPMETIVVDVEKMYGRRRS